MTPSAWALVFAWGFVACTPLVVRAQPASRESGRVDVGIGWTWTGQQAVGTADANETTSSGSGFSLFSTSTALAAASGLAGRVGVTLTRAFELEASGSYGAPALRTEISLDYENAAPVTASEIVRQFTVGGGLLWYPGRPVRPSRLAPFLSVGGGYLRELHEGSVLVGTGHFYEVGGGVRVLARAQSRAVMKGVGLRIDVGAMARSGGVAFDGRGHIVPKLGAGVFVRF